MDHICFQCIGEDFLQILIKKIGCSQICSYCRRRRKTVSINQLADWIENAIEEHYHVTSDQPSGYEDAIGRDWYRKGDSIAQLICEIAVIKMDAADEVRQVLEERHFDADDSRMGNENPFEVAAHYSERAVSDHELMSEWMCFENVLKTEARYFSLSANITLSSVFADLSTHVTAEGRSVIVEAGPDTELQSIYRARFFQNEGKLKEALERPDLGIGPPPGRAATAGRMNAHGISVFYGAAEKAIALAEVRPPVGSNVVVSRFDFIRSVRLLDLVALRSIEVKGSLFDEGFSRRLRRAKFLETLSSRISMPVMPDDESSEYLSTQAIADFLSAELSLNLDGIIYPSVQSGENGRNIVLFHKSARVEPLETPPGTEISVNLYTGTDDGRETCAWVWEEVPPNASSGKPSGQFESSSLVRPWLEPEPFCFDAREPVLRLVTGSMELHQVKEVSIQTDFNIVHRHRSEKRSSPF